MTREDAMKKVEQAKADFKTHAAIHDATAQAEKREQKAKARLKLEAFLVTHGCTWMTEFLDDVFTTEYDVTFILPEHRPIVLKFGGTHREGTWCVNVKGGQKLYRDLGGALIAADENLTV